MSASQNYNPIYVIPSRQVTDSFTALTEAAYPFIEELAKEGCGLDAIAQRLGISASTFRDIRKRDPRAQDAFIAGKSQLDTEVTTQLVKKMREGDMTATIFLAKGKLGWRETGTPADAPTTATQVNIYVSEPLTDEQFAKLTHGPASPKGDEEP